MGSINRQQVNTLNKLCRGYLFYARCLKNNNTSCRSQLNEYHKIKELIMINSDDFFGNFDELIQWDTEEDITGHFPSKSD